MECKIKVSQKLSTGQSVTNVIVRFLNGVIDLDNAKFTCTMPVWTSQANKDADYEPVWFWTTGPIGRLEYQIPEADIAQVVADGEYTVIGANHKDYVVDELATILGINTSDIEVTTLL